MTPQKIIISSVLIGAVVGSIKYLNSQKVDRRGNDEGVMVIPLDEKIASSEKTSSDENIAVIPKSDKYKLAKEITTPDGFINTGLNPDGSAKPVTIGEFIGKKVVLVDFWTYSCINCQRTTPYLNAWYEKYKEKGLVIIGVHTPEFEFEKDFQNVLEATKRMGIKFPVVLDNDFSTWNAYQNRFWPRKYLVNIDGYIIYDHIGEGAYGETEKKIQELLEARERDISIPIGVAGFDLKTPRSPEIYFGASRNTNFSNGERGKIGLQTLVAPINLQINSLFLTGDWDIQNEFAENRSVQAKIIFRYQAKNVYFVAGGDTGAKIKIIKDDKLVGEQIVDKYQLYNIIQDSESGEHVLEIIIANPGLRAFTFTFG